MALSRSRYAGCVERGDADRGDMDVLSPIQQWRGGVDVWGDTASSELKSYLVGLSTTGAGSAAGAGVGVVFVGLVLASLEEVVSDTHLESCVFLLRYCSSFVNGFLTMRALGMVNTSFCLLFLIPSPISLDQSKRTGMYVCGFCSVCVCLCVCVMFVDLSWTWHKRYM